MLLPRKSVLELQGNQTWTTWEDANQRDQKQKGGGKKEEVLCGLQAQSLKKILQSDALAPAQSLKFLKPPDPQLRYLQVCTEPLYKSLRGKEIDSKEDLLLCRK